jgi:Fibronectin type III domain
MSMAASTGTPTAAARPKAPAGGGKKYGPFTRTQWIIAGSVVGLTLAYIFWKRYENAKTAAASSSTAASSGDCTDDSGNPVPCGSGDSDLSSLEDELDSLLSGEAAAGGSGSSGTVGTTTGTTGTGTSTGTTGTGTTTSTGTSTGTSTSTASWAYPAPSGLKATAVSKTGYTLSWSPVTGPSGQKPANYTVATYNDQGTEVDQFISGSTTTKEYGKGGTGLHPGYQYHSNVWANGGPKAPAHATVSVTLKS